MTGAGHGVAAMDRPRIGAFFHTIFTDRFQPGRMSWKPFRAVPLKLVSPRRPPPLTLCGSLRLLGLGVGLGVAFGLAVVVGTAHGRRTLADATKPIAVALGLIRARPPQEGDHWSSCARARAAGTAPIYSGEPGYRDELDWDGDGVACERGNSGSRRRRWRR